MKFLKVFALIALMLMTGSVWAQGRITGRVQDKSSKENVEYATISVLKAADSSMANGNVTDSRGHFEVKNLKYGKYIVRVSFIGYEDLYSEKPIVLSESNPHVDMGRLYLAQSAEMMEAVEVTAERTMVEYQLDKRVVNVDKNIVTSGGTAADVLENVPSVAIDNDGNVTLRGSSNVKVLVDGRSYELLNSDLEVLLQQITASSIETVEVITNPSAKYDPEGMSGIINIKLKEKASGSLGWNGVANLNFGAPMPMLIPDDLPQFMPTTTGSVSLNYTTERYSINFSADAGNRNRARTGWSKIERRHNGTAYEYDSITESSVSGGFMYGFKLGGEYYFKNRSSLLASYQYHGGSHDREGTASSLDLFHADHRRDYRQTDTNGHGHNNHSINLSYLKKFDRPNQELSIDLTAAFNQMPGDGVQEKVFYNNVAYNLLNYEHRKTDNMRNDKSINILANYAHPFNDKWKLETGYEGNILFSHIDNKYFVTSYDSTGAFATHLDNLSSVNYEYQQHVHGIYATMGGQVTEKLSVQAGLRGEFSLVEGTDLYSTADTALVYKPDWQLYPTVHASYNINEKQSLQVSYSRRVRRARMWHLNPYLRIDEGDQISFGNPTLDPEFTNAFEISHNIAFEKTNIFSSVYYRQTNNMMTRYGFMWGPDSAAHYAPWMVYLPEFEGNWASTWQNLNTGYNYGLEFIVDQQVTKWWKLNLSVNLYQSHIEGTELLNNQDQSAFRGNVKLNSYMNLPGDWTIQLSGQYNSPWFDLQTTMDPNIWFDLAVKKDLWARRATVNLRVSDFLMTGGWGHTTDNSQIYRVMRSRRISPVVTFGFTYKINNGLRRSEHDKHGHNHDHGGGSSDYDSEGGY